MVSDPLSLDVEAQSAYVVGFPVHVWTVLRLEAPGVSWQGLPWLGPLAESAALGVVVETEDGRPVLETAARLSSSTLEAGGDLCLRSPAVLQQLVDLSARLGSVDPGSYRLAVRLPVSARRVLHSPSVVVQLRPPDELRQQALRALGPELARVGRSWAAWAKDPPPSIDLLRAEILSDDPLRLLRVYRRLLWDPQPLAAIDLRLLDVLGGFHAPQAQVLRAEMMLARGDRAEAERIRDATLDQSPGLAASFAAVLDEPGLVTLLRDLTGVEPYSWT
ncbi:MAG: hypothetical protein AB1Z98_21305 [Nannocystaceae bacterium]